MKYYRTVLIALGILIGFIPVPALAKQMNIISDEAFVHCVQTHTRIQGKIINSTAIISSLKWLQIAASNNQKIGNNQLPETLIISDSIIKGNLDIANFKRIPIVLHIKNSTFEGQVKCEKVKFEKEVWFEGVTFKDSSIDSADFSEATFIASADFESAIFKGGASFASATFAQGCGFANASFQGLATFDYATFPSGSQNNFDQAIFKKVIEFDHAIVDSPVSFVGTKFLSDAYFTNINYDKENLKKVDGFLGFFSTTFQGRVYFSDSKLPALWFSYVYGNESSEPNQQPLQEAGVPVVFPKRAVFRGLQCGNADFSQVEFRDYSDFSKAQFAKFVSFKDATFKGTVNFYKAFPFILDSSGAKQKKPNLGLQGTRVILDGVQFQSNFNLNWTQVKNRVFTKEPETWERLEEAFRSVGNLEGQNDAMYQRRLSEGAELGSTTQWLSNRLECWFWGYGVRPWRLAIWMSLLFLCFTIVYWSQTKPLTEGINNRQGKWNRVWFALGFSSKTARVPLYGYQNSRTTFFKTLTTVHFVSFMLMLYFLLKAFSNISPALKDLVRKILPF